MKLHANARTCPKSRKLLVDRIQSGRSRECVAAELGVTPRTVSKWMARYRAEGEAGLVDRSSMPRRQPTKISPQRVQTIEALRRVRFTGPEIAELLDMPSSTVAAVLKRSGMGRLGRLGLEPARRYEHARPGDMVHIDVKKLGRIVGGAGKRFHGGSSHYTGSFTDAARRRRGRAGWDYVHIAIDDCTRLAYAEVLPDEKAITATAFLRRAVAFFARHGITTRRLLTDNGSPYRSTIHALACHTLGIRHLRTRPRRPQTNGKAERFIRTLQHGWAYGAIYATSAERTAALDGWIHHYNHHRPHQALGRQPPIHRLNNLTGSYS